MDALIGDRGSGVGGSVMGDGMGGAGRDSKDGLGDNGSRIGDGVGADGSSTRGETLPIVDSLPSGLVLPLAISYWLCEGSIREPAGSETVSVDPLDLWNSFDSVSDLERCGLPSKSAIV